MTTIKGYIQMLLKQGLGELTEEQKKSLDIVLRNTNRLDRLIEDILDVSRLESGTMKFIPNKINVKTMVDETIESLQPYADLKDIKILTDVKEDVPQLFIDKERIRQVITNLVNNAIKFSSKKSNVKIKVKKDKKDVLFEVQDFGRGIPEDKQDKVFKLFYQVDAGMDRKFGGAGLGLAISRGIVMAHGGEIWVESKEGTGSSFKFTLPVEPIIDLEQKFESLDMFSKESEKDEDGTLNTEDISCI
jgi:signal transduction histidine kinase